jgi:hypothetical protein
MDDLERIRQAVEELIEPRRHREPRTYQNNRGTWIKEDHITEVPSLLDQLAAAIPGRVGDQTSRSFSSRTPARDDALDVLALIDTEAWTWCSRQNLPRRDTAGNVRALVGLATRLTPDDLSDLRWNCTSWVGMARVTTGWDKPAFSPVENTCPLCGKRGGVRIRVTYGDGYTDANAACLNCHEHWDSSNIMLLARHIRWENGDDLDAEAAS